MYLTEYSSAVGNSLTTSVRRVAVYVIFSITALSVDSVTTLPFLSVVVEVCSAGPSAEVGAPSPPEGVVPYPPAGAPSPPSGAPYPPVGAPSPPEGAPSPPVGAPYPPVGAPYPPAGAPSPEGVVGCG